MKTINECCKKFTEHPHDVGETYFSHLLFTLKCSFCLLKSSIALFIHGFLPFTFQHYTSDEVARLNEQFQSKKKVCCE